MHNTQPFFTKALAGLLTLVLSLSAPAEFAHAKDSNFAAAKAINIGSRLELMLDDYLIGQKSESTLLRLHHPVRREVSMTLDRAWEGNMSNFVTTIQDSDLYRMYYRGSRIKDTTPIMFAHSFSCYAESREGIHWTRPDLGIIEFNGSKKNNITLKGGCAFNFTPFLDKNPHCKPSEKFKALGGGSGGLIAWKSADGLKWTVMSKEPVHRDAVKNAFDSQNQAFWDPLRECYVLYYRAWRDGRDVKTTTSKDFLHWTEPSWLEYTPSRTTELYTNQIVPYYRAPHLYVGFPVRYIPNRGWFSPINESISKLKNRCGTSYSDTGFITSRDGKKFNVWPEAFVRPGPSPEQWMYGFGYLALGMVETKSDVPGGPNEISFYNGESGYYKGPGVSLCRYTLRQDGFVSAHAPLSGGWLITKPIIFDGEKMRVNFETSAAGSLQIEIQDVQGKPLPGFTLAESPSLFGNSTDYAVEWKSNLSDLAGKPVRLRFVLKDADLYAFQFGGK